MTYQVISHYCSSSTNRYYSDPLLNIKKMHELFTEKCEMREVGFENVEPVHFQVYRQIFCEPKKEKCSACEAYKKLKVSAQERKTRIGKRGW